ncbi:MAG: TolC family protein [Prolixibacteraceae bacterium]|nr:TolC family protein [Prolixibacteraceae bacterium]
MKTKNYLNLLLLSSLIIAPLFLLAQQKIELAECKEWARANYPRLKQTELLQKISALKMKNNRSAYLPLVNLKGQATYQSEVVSFDIPLPGIDLEFPSNDQYKVYLDIRQPIWDGGMVHSKNQLDHAALEADLQKLEVEAYQLNTIVNNYFFGLLLVDQNQNILEVQIEVLNNQYQRLLSAFGNGVARKKDCDKLKAEILMMKQKLLDVKSKRKALADVLSVVTGRNLNSDVELVLPDVSVKDNNTMARPEFRYFELQQEKLIAGDKMLSSSRNPVLFAFGQAGYGKPGLNMISNEFDTYYLFGVGLSWRITDWNLTGRKKQINAFQRETIGTLQADFMQKQQIQLVEAREKISNLKQLLETDEELVRLRKSITKKAAAELENGTVTSTDYLTDLNAETLALISVETHKIQLVQAIENYNTLVGKSFKTE